MNKLSVLIVIDAAAALAGGELAGNVCMVDTNGFLGSWLEGSDSLHTLCQDGQVITWNVASISPSSDVAINGFSGAMVSSAVCTPVLQEQAGDGSWSGRIEAQGAFASYSYTVAISIEGQSMSFSPFIKVA